MLTRALTVLALAPLAACIVYETPSGEPVNPPPYFTYADAGCYADDVYRDFVWYFDVDAQDAAGDWDVVEVYADVFDTWDGAWIDGFELFHEQGPTWYSAWVGSSTWLDCRYDGYVVDFTAVDSLGQIDVVSVVPVTW